MSEKHVFAQRSSLLGDVLIGGLIVPAILVTTLMAPVEATMGKTYRILFVHVPMAWLGLLGFMLMAAMGVAYLIGRDLKWDRWAQAAAELGWLCSSLTLVTGSIWAHEAWGTWWTWEPRLASAFVLWLIYSGCLILRAGVEDRRRRARLASVLAIVGMLDIPLVVMATRWFRGIHPVSPELVPSMRIVLLFSIGAFTGLFVTLLCRRRSQLRREDWLTAQLAAARH